MSHTPTERSFDINFLRCEQTVEEKLMSCAVDYQLAEMVYLCKVVPAFILPRSRLKRRSTDFTFPFTGHYLITMN